MYKRKVCICNTVPEESFKSPRSMSSFHSVMHRSAVDVWARWSPWRHTTGRKCRSWLLPFLSLFLSSYQYTKQLHLSLFVRCRRTSWVEQCLRSLHFHGFLHFVHMQVNEEEFALKEILYLTTFYSITNTLWVCVTEISSTMYNANTRQQDGSPCFSSIFYTLTVTCFLTTKGSLLSPVRAWKPATWVPACRVCVWTAASSKGSTTSQLLQPITCHGPINTHQRR